MSSSRKPGQYTIGSRAVAVAIVSEVLERAAADVGGWEYASGQAMAESIVQAAWDVEYKPNAERLVLIVDASISDKPSEPATGDDFETRTNLDPTDPNP